MTSLPVQPELPAFASKTCTVCGQTKPLDEFYVKVKSTGRRLSWCKVCSAEKSRAWHQEHSDLVAERARRRRDADPEREQRNQARYRERHREEVRERNRQRALDPSYKAKKAAYRESHSEEERQRHARYRQENKERIAEYNRRYYQENKAVVDERIRASIAKNPDKYREIRSSWKRQNKDAVNASTHRRRARLRHNGGTWAEDDWQRLKAQCDWRCLMCGKQEMTDGITLCFDHVVPLSSGGYNIISNGQPLCRSCNSLKHRKVLDLRPDFLRL